MARAVLYEPINVLKPVAPELWVVDGPIVKMALFGVRLPFPTRMTLIRLPDGGIFVCSPTELTPPLQAEVAALGPVRHVVSPNRFHYTHVAAWKRAFPDAVTWASPGVRERAAEQRIEVGFDRDLGDGPDPAWAGAIDQVLVRGSRFVEEVVFFHRETRTAILTDLIVSFEREKVPVPVYWGARLASAAHPDGQTPQDLRLTFRRPRTEVRACVERILAWQPERVILAHGHWYAQDGEAELRRAFRWVLGTDARTEP